MPPCPHYGSTATQNFTNPQAMLQSAHAAGWSSQVARRAHNPKVAGSNPAPATAGPGEPGPLSLPHNRTQIRPPRPSHAASCLRTGSGAPGGDPAGRRAAPAPFPAPAGITVRCQMLFEDFATLCPVDKNGEITLPAGITVPRFFVVLGG
jgi:hypothetical protein